jgi:hypothetical protein
MTKQELIYKMKKEGRENPTYTYIFGIPCRIFPPFKTRKGITEQMVQIGSRGGAGVAMHIEQAAHRLIEMKNDVTITQRQKIDRWIATPSTVFID